MSEHPNTSYAIENERLQIMLDKTLGGFGQDALGEDALNNLVAPDAVEKRFTELLRQSLFQLARLSRKSVRRLEKTIDLERAGYFQSAGKNIAVRMSPVCSDEFNKATSSFNTKLLVFERVLRAGLTLCDNMGDLDYATTVSIKENFGKVQADHSDATVCLGLHDEALMRFIGGKEPFDADQNPLLGADYDHYSDVAFRVAHYVDEIARDGLVASKNLIVFLHFMEVNFRHHYPELLIETDKMVDVLGEVSQTLIDQGREFHESFDVCNHLGMSWAGQSPAFP